MFKSLFYPAIKREFFQSHLYQIQTPYKLEFHKRNKFEKFENFNNSFSIEKDLLNQPKDLPNQPKLVHLHD